MNWVSIHNHSHYSMLDGLASPEELVKKASELGQSAVGITDHGSISGAIKLIRACKEHNVKPIVGIEAYFVDDASEKAKGEKKYHIIIIAKNESGFNSICKTMTRAHENFYYKPRIDLNSLYDMEDVIISTACMKGILSHPDYEKLTVLLKEKFEDDFYLEIMPILGDEQNEINGRAIKLSKSLSIPLLATNDVHYLNKEDEKIHNFLLRMNTGGKFEFSVSGLYLKTADEMYKSMFQAWKEVSKKNIEEAMENTIRLADSTNLQLEQKEISLPSIYPGNPIDVLNNLANNPSYSKEYQERLDYELDIIDQRGFTNYFLLVYDFVNWARGKGWELGAGRGSAAGSLLCYCLGITGIDPIKEGLVFERFLNPERSDYPDIDIDIPKSKRGLAIEYFKEKYGKDRVANLSTASKLQIRSAFKDVAKEFGVSFMEANYITSLIGDETTLSDAIKNNQELATRVNQLNKSQEIIELTDKVSGTLRQSGTHAAGIVISPSPVTDFGIMEQRRGTVSLNWDMKDVEFFGLVKIDVLGLRTLDIIGETLELIYQRHRQKINWKDINLETDDILNEFSQGNTTGIFQFETKPLTSLLRKLNPIHSKSVLVDANALVRPGPMDSGMTATYVNRHHGKYDKEEKNPYDIYIEDIVSDTHDVIVYQEQVINILVKVAGYSIPQADVVRRAFAKKQAIEEFEKHREDFIIGCEKTSDIDKEISSKLFDDLEKFSRYGFNKSHAAAYTELALRQMYLKINYPIEYMTALYRWTEEESKKVGFTDECRRIGINLISPDINKSDADFKIVDDGIMIGLSAIKQVGDKAIEAIINQRKLSLFKDIIDFRIRLPRGKVTKNTLNSLIMAGCFRGINAKWAIENDEWGETLIKGKTQDFEIRKFLYGKGEDFTEDRKEINKVSIMPGVYKLHVEPELGLNLDQNRLNEVKEFIYKCEMCGLRKIYECPVSFDCNELSRLMVIGEAPGEEETRQGKPFAPPRNSRRKNAGSVLEEAFLSCGIAREELYITNVFKCRPENNKLPENPPKDCYQILRKEIEVIRPKLILALGATALEFFTGNRAGIQAIADKLLIQTEIVDEYPVPVLYSVHPASLLYGDGGPNEERLKAAIQKVSQFFYKIKEENK